MLIAKAAAFSARAHNGQLRKDGITPYFYHCSMVAYFVQKYCSDETNINDMIAAAYLHDTIEDCDISIDEIKKEFGDQIAGYVLGLTNVYTKKAFPKLNRQTRKNAECVRLVNEPVNTQQIKLADRLANIIDLSGLDGGFRSKFIDETKKLVGCIGNSHKVLKYEILSRIK